MRQELSPAIEDYLRFRKSQDYSKGTLKVDQGRLKAFLANTGNIWVHQIEARHVERHFEIATKTRRGASLIADHGVLSRFFKWCRATSRMPVENDPMYGRRQPRAQKKERNRIPVTEFPRLLDTAEARDPRDRAVVALLLYTLARDSEIVTLRLRDLNLDQSWLRLRIHKTRQEDDLPIPTELDREMRRWLTYYTQQVGPLEPHYFLVPARGTKPVRNDYGRIVSHDSLYRPEKQIRASGRIVTPTLEQMGFPTTDAEGNPTHEGAHTIRRSGARALFDQLVEGGYDHSLRIVQSMLHHASVQQTERYIGITADRRSRDEILRARMMYGSTSDENVVRLAR